MPVHALVAQWYLPAGRQGAEAFMDVYSVYALRSEKDGRLYVGMSQDVLRRLGEHNAGYVFSTKGYCPWILVYEESVGTRVQAREREKYLKSGTGKELLKRILLQC